jgi:3',5'-cyclic-AMP phosphodiesterase
MLDEACKREVRVMRRQKMIVKVSMVLALVICAASLIIMQSKAMSAAWEEEHNGVTFSVLSDIHANTNKLRSAIIDLYFINQDTDAMILNGDVTDEGIYEQYDQVKKELDNYSSMLPATVIQNIGNHEYFNYKKGRNTLADVLNYRNLYFQFTGNLNVYHDTWIRGYHFISLGSENANLKGPNPPNAADLSENQLKWLKEKLKEKYEPGKPVFVFLHQHLKTSIVGWKGVIQEDELTKILSDYPDVILFTSHTHVSLAIDSVVQTEPFTIVNTGAIDFINIPDKKISKRMYKENQGIYVQVNGNRVVINGRDFSNSEWMFSREITK